MASRRSAFRIGLTTKEGAEMPSWVSAPGVPCLLADQSTGKFSKNLGERPLPGPRRINYTCFALRNPYENTTQSTWRDYGKPKVKALGVLTFNPVRMFLSGSMQILLAGVLRCLILDSRRCI